MQWIFSDKIYICHIHGIIIQLLSPWCFADRWLTCSRILMRSLLAKKMKWVLAWITWARNRRVNCLVRWCALHGSSHHLLVWFRLIEVICMSMSNWSKAQWFNFSYKLSVFILGVLCQWLLFSESRWSWIDAKGWYTLAEDCFGLLWPPVAVSISS